MDPLVARSHESEDDLHFIGRETMSGRIATHGQHRFFEEEGELVRDIRKVPLRVGDYSLTVRQGNYLKKSSEDDEPQVDGRPRARVLIAREKYQELRAFFLDIAVHRSAEKLAWEFFNLPFEPYAPIRKQILNLLRLVNESRHEAGYAKLTPNCIRYRRRIVKPFDDEERSENAPQLSSGMLGSAHDGSTTDALALS